MEPDPQDDSKSQPRKGLDLLGTALLMAGSALFGGLAVVLWNRKALSGLRQTAAHPENPSSSANDEDT